MGGFGRFLRRSGVLRRDGDAPAAAGAEVVAIEFRIPNMVCEGCAEKIDGALHALPGVREVRPNVAQKRIRVSFEPGRVDAQQLRNALRTVGDAALDVESRWPRAGKSLDPRVGVRVCTDRQMARLLIGDVAQRTGLTAPTIRYYESIGLIAAPARSTTGYRRYTNTTVEELQFIKKAQALGFSLEEIGEILKLSRAGDTPCSHVLDLSRRHLAALDQRIQQLSRFRDQLASEVAKWDGEQEPTCRG